MPNLITDLLIVPFSGDGRIREDLQIHVSNPEYYLSTLLDFIAGSHGRRAKIIFKYEDRDDTVLLKKESGALLLLSKAKSPI